MPHWDTIFTLVYSRRGAFQLYHQPDSANGSVKFEHGLRLCLRIRWLGYPSGKVYILFWMPRFLAKIAVVYPPSIEQQRESKVQVNGNGIEIVQQYADIIQDT